MNSTTTINVYLSNASGTYTTLAVTSSTTPMTWTNGDAVTVNFTYEAA
jgi:hypothetical protein